MRTLVVTTYWETVDRERNLGTEHKPFYAVNKGDFVVKSRVFYGGEGRSVRELVKDARRMRRFAGWIRGGFRTPSESQYGIASYQEVTIQ